MEKLAWRKGASQANYLQQIEQLGGRDKVDATMQAFHDMESAMAKNVASAPDAFGATADAQTQQQAVNRIMQHMSEQYLKQLAADLRRQSGYIQVCGLWLHRSLITFLVYGLMAAVALTFFVPMVFSPKPGAWWHGIAGLVLTLGVVIAILTRVRN